MKAINLALIIDTLFCSLIGFLLFFIIFYYFFGRDITLGLSITFGILMGFIAFKIFLEKNKTKITLKKDKKMYNQCMMDLNFMKRSEILGILKSAYDKTNEESEIKNGKLYVHSKKQVIFLKFGFSDITKADIVRAYNSIGKGYTAIIISETYSQEIKNFASRFDNRIKLLDGKELFYFLKKNSCIPQKKSPITAEEKPKISLKNFLNKKSALRFLIFGAVFIVFSYFVPYKLYYLLSGVFFLVLSFLSKFFGKSTQEEN